MKPIWALLAGAAAITGTLIYLGKKKKANPILVMRDFQDLPDETEDDELNSETDHESDNETDNGTGADGE